MRLRTLLFSKRRYVYHFCLFAVSQMIHRTDKEKQNQPNRHHYGMVPQFNEVHSNCELVQKIMTYDTRRHLSANVHNLAVKPEVKLLNGFHISLIFEHKITLSITTEFDSFFESF